MSCNKCNCNKCTCGCVDTCEPVCTSVCTALVVTNSWNVPACGALAVLSIPGLTSILIGSYVWNPTYGWFRVTAFDSVNGQVTVINECLAGNAVPGSVVPALTLFVFGTPPGTTNTVFEGISAGTAYTIMGVSSPLVFGTTQASITLALPGTYLLLSSVSVGGNGLTQAGQGISAGLRRQNNTPADLIAHQPILAVPTTTVFTGTFNTIELPPDIYTTLNSDDLINISINYVGAAPSAGTFEALSARVVAVKLL